MIDLKQSQCLRCGDCNLKLQVTKEFFGKKMKWYIDLTEARLPARDCETELIFLLFSAKMMTIMWSPARCK